MTKGMFGKHLLLCFALLSCLISTNAQNATDTTPSTTEGSGGTTTPEASGGEPCDVCSTAGEICPEDCDCKEYDLVRPLVPNNICAEPCDQKYEWCEKAGEECDPNAESDGYNCRCGAEFYSVGDFCEKARVFGGSITFKIPYNASIEEDMKADIKEILEDMYNGTDGFVEAVVLSLASGSTIAQYKLVYELGSDTTDEDIEAAFMESTSNCEGPQATTSKDDYEIICADSIGSVVNNTVLCDVYGDTLGCDSNTAYCEYANGRQICQCQSNQSAKQYDDATFCVAVTCTNDGECNEPFGWCDKSDANNASNVCGCMFGFSGIHCTSPWEFVFTIVTAGLGLILIIVLVACICTTRKTKTVQKSLPQDDLDLKNPFVDFQPGIRAKVPSHLYSTVSDSLDGANGGERQSHTNGAYSNAYDDLNLHTTSTFSEGAGKSTGNDYF